MPYTPAHGQMSTEELVAQRMQVAQNAKEIEIIRARLHELAQKPNADGLRIQGIEMMLDAQNKATALAADHQDKQAAQTLAILEKIQTTLNGDDDKPGIKGRLDRVEGKMSTLTRFLWIIAGTAAAVFVKTFWGLFTAAK